MGTVCHQPDKEGLTSSVSLDRIPSGKTWSPIILFLLICCLKTFGQRQVGVYQVDTVKAHTELHTWIEEEKEKSFIYLRLLSVAKYEEVHLYLESLEYLHIAKESLPMYQDTLDRQTANLKKFDSQLGQLKLVYEQELARFWDRQLTASLDLVRSDEFDFVIEERQLLYYNPQTSSQKDVSKQVISQMNKQTESDSFREKWLIFKICWRLMYAMKSYPE